MASEIRVDKINSLSGVGTVTLSPTGVDISGITTVSTLKVGTGVTASEDGDIFFTGIATATTFSGSGASLTALPAAQVTGTLPAISGANLTALNGSNIASGTVADARISTLTASKLSGALPAISALNLTNVPAANVVGVHTSLNITGATVVGSAVTISESGIEASGIGITVANINGEQIGGRKNIIINGAMQIAERSTSAVNTPAGGPKYQTLDRWLTWANQADLFSVQQVADAPSGFKYSLKVTSLGANPNQSYQTIGQRIESQNLTRLNLGTAYAKPFSVSFWVKSSLTGTFTGYCHGVSSFQPSFVFTYTVSAANTWEHKKINIPSTGTVGAGKFGSGGAERGLEFGFTLSGESYKTSSANTWLDDTYKLEVSGVSSVDVTGTNGATFYVTGVQLEAGTQATPFEHLTFAEELRLCQRYYYENKTAPVGMFICDAADTSQSYGFLRFPVAMRAAPTVVLCDNNGNTDGKVTQHGAAHDIAATAQQIQKEGFCRCNKSSGSWNATAGRPIVAGVTSAEAEL